MKKLFLTSGLVLCMACPAFAVSNGYIEGEVANPSADECVQDVLGVDSGSATLEAVWNANISGAITLDSNRYAASDSVSAASTATTTAAPTPLYSKYATGIYSDSTAETAVTTLSTDPVMTGYAFQGFYTGKAGTGTQVIDGNGDVLSAASTQITSIGTSATWYAHWVANSYGLVYTCGTAGSHAVQGTAPTDNSTYAYDSTVTQLAASAGTCAETGYTFTGWECNNNGATVTSDDEGVVANGGFTWNTTGNITCVAQWEANTIELQWNTNGATSGSIANTECEYDGGITLPAQPTKTGYTFGGWQVVTPAPNNNG